MQNTASTRGYTHGKIFIVTILREGLGKIVWGGGFSDGLFSIKKTHGQTLRGSNVGDGVTNFKLLFKKTKFFAAV